MSTSETVDELPRHKRRQEIGDRRLSLMNGAIYFGPLLILA